MNQLLVKIRFVLFLLLGPSLGLFAQNRLTEQKFSIQTLLSPKLYSESIDNAFEIKKFEEYIPLDTNSILIENGYASSFIKNPEEWSERKRTIVPDTVKVIFSMYPKHQEFWMTNYHVLLAQRLKALFRIAPELNSNEINWLLVLQTDCSNEPEAIGLFHGFDIIGTPTTSSQLEPIPLSQSTFIDSITMDSSKLSDQYLFVDNFIKENGGYSDSTVVKVLDRNKSWEDAIVVLDWTGSMYHHGAMSVLWHITNLEDTYIKYFTFFNDGNRKKKRQKKIGKTGGIYSTSAHDIKKVAQYFIKIQRRGNGGDSSENDVEALKRAQKKFPDHKNLILVADNRSCMRDFSLFYKIKSPVHIILPGNDEVINHQYINLAYKTKGSIHTFDQDILDFSTGEKINKITINGTTYFKNHYGFFQPANPLSYHFCNPFYGIKKYTKRIRDAFKN